MAPATEGILAPQDRGHDVPPVPDHVKDLRLAITPEDPLDVEEVKRCLLDQDRRAVLLREPLGDRGEDLGRVARDLPPRRDFEV